MEALYERVAGLDIGKATLTVCVRTPGPRGGRRTETRTFPTMSRSLQVMRDWLLAEGVTIAAMESTSTYWKGAFYCLEEALEVWLVNAAHIKSISRRRKTDLSVMRSGSPSCWSAACSARRSCRRRTSAGCAC